MSRWDEIWSHLRWVYERTDRAYTVASAGWYEANEPWDLAGLKEKVRRAIDKKESEREAHRDRDSGRKPEAAGEGT